MITFTTELDIYICCTLLCLMMTGPTDIIITISK